MEQLLKNIYLEGELSSVPYTKVIMVDKDITLKIYPPQYKAMGSAYIERKTDKLGLYRLNNRLFDAYIDSHNYNEKTQFKGIYSLFKELFSGIEGFISNEGTTALKWKINGLDVELGFRFDCNLMQILIDGNRIWLDSIGPEEPNSYERVLDKAYRIDVMLRLLRAIGYDQVDASYRSVYSFVRLTQDSFSLIGNTLVCKVGTEVYNVYKEDGVIKLKDRNGVTTEDRTEIEEKLVWYQRNI